MSNLPVEEVVIQRVDHQGVANSSLVFKIPPTVAEHHMVLEALKAIKRQWPGAWYCAMEWYRDEQQTAQRARIGREKEEVPAWKFPTMPKPIDGIKKVTAASLGIPDPGPVDQDVPQ